MVSATTIRGARVEIRLAAVGKLREVETRGSSNGGALRGNGEVSGCYGSRYIVPFMHFAPMPSRKCQKDIRDGSHGGHGISERPHTRRRRHSRRAMPFGGLGNGGPPPAGRGMARRTPVARSVQRLMTPATRVRTGHPGGRQSARPVHLQVHGGGAIRA